MGDYPLFFFLPSITRPRKGRHILLSSTLPRRKTPMRISCITSSEADETRRDPHCGTGCHRGLLPSAHRRSRLTIVSVREPSWLYLKFVPVLPLALRYKAWLSPADPLPGVGS